MARNIDNNNKQMKLILKKEKKIKKTLCENSIKITKITWDKVKKKQVNLIQTMEILYLPGHIIITLTFENTIPYFM